MSAMILDISEAVAADIFVYDDGKSYEGLTWPNANGTAIILCPDCGELDDNGEVYSTFGDPLTCTQGDRCNVCKCHGYMRIGL